ncbi:membrane-associated protein, putative [Bodo saltans]|uniref:Membrane-associated protein, putative n=1 Tax=Bodo saltans TaxID=75058 RepID=A0A0S4JK64_BODSA|nr:membrane-associated protein, putative [Bodo saltans]|eukprot:CUG90563.1 membrane-associated protein, putative [Bodo saltans]
MHAAASRRFVLAYGSLFTSMWPHRHWWFLADTGTSIVVGLLAALPSLVVHRSDAATLVPAVCTGALHAATALQLLFFLVYVAAWPVAIRWENTASLTNAFLGALGALLMSLATAGIDGLDDATNDVGTAQVALSILILVLGMTEEGFALLTSQPLRWSRFLPRSSFTTLPSLLRERKKNPEQRWRQRKSELTFENLLSLRASFLVSNSTEDVRVRMLETIIANIAECQHRQLQTLL